jgi:hypothetical protein
MLDNQLTFGETWAQKSRDLLDQSVGGNEGVVFSGKLLNQLLVLIQLLQVIRRHCINAVVLGSINIMLISENAVQPMELVWRIRQFDSGLSAYQMLIPGRGTLGSLTVPEKRLSRWGS